MYALLKADWLFVSTTIKLLQAGAERYMQVQGASYGQ